MKPLQQLIIETLKVKPTIDAQKEIRLSIDFLKRELKKVPTLTTFVLGISGGQDSTLAGRLAQLAIEELRQETQNDAYRFVAVRLPYGVQADEADAQKALAFIQPDEVVTINIKPAVDSMVETLMAQGVAITDFNKGNIKARQRMIAQYAIAGARAGLVIGTDHAAEAVTGFYTKYGDGGADVVPLWRLNKRQGKALLQALGAQESLYLKVPTADLEDDKPLVSDEVALGVTYDDIDDYLEGKQIAESAAAIIEKWYTNSEHKRHMPKSVYDNF